MNCELVSAVKLAGKIAKKVRSLQIRDPGQWRSCRVLHSPQSCRLSDRPGTSDASEVFRGSLAWSISRKVLRCFLGLSVSVCIHPAWCRHFSRAVIAARNPFSICDLPTVFVVVVYSCK